MSRNFRTITGLVSLVIGLGVASVSLAAPPSAVSFCSDPAVVAAIDRKETGLINGNRVPGSGVALHSLDAPALSGVQITGHRIEVLGGDFGGNRNFAICRIKLHVEAQTPEGRREAEEEFTYRIERSDGAVDVTFCANRQCPNKAHP